MVPLFSISLRKYYIDVKQRENAFVLNTRSPTRDSTSSKTVNERRIFFSKICSNFQKFTYGKSIEYPSVYRSSYTNTDTRSTLPHFQQKPRQIPVKLMIITFIYIKYIIFS